MSNPIPLLDLRAQHGEIQKEIFSAVDQVFSSQQFIMGGQVQSFEQAVAGHLGCSHGIGLASGTDALTLSLRALDIGPGDEVIVPSFTFYATVESVLHVGATPVFVDIDAETYCMDVSRAGALIGAHTRAILPVHLFGHPADMTAIARLADRHGLKVIEDNAQAFGAKHAGRFTGSMGDAGCLSFFPSKNLGGCGDGGMVVTDSDQAADRLRMLRMHGWKKKNFPEIVGYNSRLDTLQAAILHVKLPMVDRWNEQRRRCADRYKSALGSADLVLPTEREDAYHVYNLYVVRVRRRDRVQRILNERGIGNAVYYPAAIHELPPCAPFVREGQRFPEAERAAREVLAIPMFPGMTGEQQERVADALLASLI